MKVLFFVYDYSVGNNNSNLQKDLIKVFSENGHDVYVISMSDEQESKMIKDGKINVIYAATGGMYQVKSKIIKLKRFFLKNLFFTKAYFKFYKDIKFDVIIGYAPYNANLSLVKRLKKMNSKKILFIWDFFPDNVRDLGILKNRILYKILKFRERKMYRSYDYLIVNSEGGLEYLKTNYHEIDLEKVFLVRNSEYIDDKIQRKTNEEIRLKYGYGLNEKLLIFGGNIGVAQKVENILKVAEKIKNKDIKFLIVGYGNEKSKIIQLKGKKKLENVIIYDSLKKEKYEELLKVCDMGIISLNEKLNVPNAPTKMTSYLKNGIPIFAILDNYTVKDLGKLIIENDIGYWIKAIDINENSIEELEKYINNIDKEKIVKNCIEFYKKEFDINKAYEKIMKIIEK